MFASLMLGTRFAARWVFVGAAAALVVHVIIAGLWRSLCCTPPAAKKKAKVRPPRPVPVMVRRGRWWPPCSRSSSSVSGRHHSDRDREPGREVPQPACGRRRAVLGLWAAALLAITAGRSLLRVISVTLLHLIGAVIFFGVRDLLPGPCPAMTPPPVARVGRSHGGDARAAMRALLVFTGVAYDPRQAPGQTQIGH